MSDTHEEIIKRLMPLYEQAPARFMAFYNAVWLMCYELPEGQSFRISDRCSERRRNTFLDIVTLCIIEEPYDIERGELYLSEDSERVCRGIGFRPSNTYHTHFYQK